MIGELIREAPAGQLIRYLSNNRFLKYPEERSDFVLPPDYQSLLQAKQAPPTLTVPTPVHSTVNLASTLASEDTIAETAPNADRMSEKEATVLKAGRRDYGSMVREKSSDGTILVDWYNKEDPENPQNWSDSKRLVVTLIICFYTFAVYVGSAIYISSEYGVMATFGVSDQKALLPLSLYVLAYGVGPMLFAPISELPAVGRSPVYASTFFIFVILSAPTATVKSFNGLVALRFFQGFFGSPCLANGGATMSDMYSERMLPYAMTVWVAAAFGGPALGPLLSGFAVTAEGWRWSFWEILWLAGPICILMMLILAETSTPTLLYHRAARLRRLTGSSLFKSQSEIDQHRLTASTIAFRALIKPVEICMKDPGVLFTNIYTSLIYAIYYSFFDALIGVYPPLYGFDLGQLGLLFICIIVSCVIGATLYASYIYVKVNPVLRLQQNNGQEPPQQEFRLKPAVFASFGLPIGLFIFGWTATPSIHWIVSVIGIVIFSVCNFLLFQCLSLYVPASYPQYSASLFAANDLCRSALAAGAIHFAKPLYGNLGIGKGISVLASISVMGMIGMFLLFFCGATMRRRSKFAVS